MLGSTYRLQVLSKSLLDCGFPANGVVVKKESKSRNIEGQLVAVAIAEEYRWLAYAMSKTELVINVRVVGRNVRDHYGAFSYRASYVFNNETVCVDVVAAYDLKSEVGTDWLDDVFVEGGIFLCELHYDKGLRPKRLYKEVP